MRNQGYSKLDGVLKVLLIFFIALLAFTGGVFAGKKMAEKSYDHIALSNKEYSKDKFPTLVTEEETDTEMPLSQQEMEALAEDAVKTAQNAQSENGGTQSEGGDRAVASEGHAAPADTHGSPAHGSKDTHAAAATKDAHSAPAHEAPAHAAAPASHSAPAHAAPSHAAPAHGAKSETSHTTPAAHHAAPAQKNTHGPASESPAAQRVAEGLPPSQNVHPKTQPTAQLPTAVGDMKSGYTVQVGSYPTESEAKKFANDLTGKGHPAFTVSADVKGKTWHRVCVGTYKNADEAAQAKKELLGKGLIKAGLVQKIAK